jgi:ribosomal protein L17
VGKAGQRMPSSKRSIVLYARRLLDRHDDRAVAVAEEMVAHLVAIGDIARADDWRRIVEAIIGMARSKSHD